MKGMNENDEFFWLSEFNLKPEVLGENHLPKRLKIYDTTLRDGEQTVGVVFNKDEKLRIAKALDEVGVNRIEAGMPVVSKEDKEAVELILKADLKAEIWGFCRAVKGDIDACADVGIRHIVCEIPTSSYKWKAYHFTQEGVVGKMIESLVYAKSKGMYTAFFAVDATRSDIQVLEMIYKKAVREGQANEVVIVDTLGVATPETMFYLTKKVREWVPVPVMTHCHNDFGLATACTLFSIKAGADYAQLTINGLGEKTGNADLAETVIASALYGLQTNIDLKRICEASKLVEKISKIKISPLRPVVGKNVFKRESGVAVAQLITYPPSVEGYSPEILGKRREILIGKKSGKSSIEYKLKGMGISATPEEIEKILEEVKDFANRKKGLISQKEFVKIVREIKTSFTKQNRQR